MAEDIQRSTRGEVEMNNYQIDYADGEVAILDHVRDLSILFPLKINTNIIAICISGNLTMTINSKSVEVSKGDVLLFPSNLRLENSHFSEGFECKALSLTDRILQGLIRDKMEIWNHAVYVCQKYVIRMSDSCKREFGYYDALIRSKVKGQNTAANNEVIRTIIRALLLELCEFLNQIIEPQHERRVSQGKLLFNRFLSMLSSGEVKRKPVSYYAAQLAITPKYLTMLCLKYSDKTASDWIVQYTLEDIRFYLSNRGLSIKEVVAKLGFANMSHFGSYVRKHLGMSPSEYRMARRQ